MADVALEARDHLGAGLLIAAEHLVQILGIEPGRKRGRADHVAEHHGQLPALGVVAGPRRLGARRRREGDVGWGAKPAARRRRLLQGRDRAHQALAIAERDPELDQIRLGQVGQDVEADVAAREGIGVSAKAEALEPCADISHRFPALASQLGTHPIAC